MAYKITNECLNCGACFSECPVGAICEGKETYTIDKAKCTQCGLCSILCPLEAIIEEDENEVKLG